MVMRNIFLIVFLIHTTHIASANPDTNGSPHAKYHPEWPENLNVQQPKRDNLAARILTAITPTFDNKISSFQVNSDSRGYEAAISLDDKFVFVLGMTSGLDLKVWDKSDLETPVVVGSLTNSSIVGFVRDLELSSDGRTILVLFRELSAHGCLLIIDVSNFISMKVSSYSCEYGYYGTGQEPMTWFTPFELTLSPNNQSLVFMSFPCALSSLDITNLSSPKTLWTLDLVGINGTCKDLSFDTTSLSFCKNDEKTIFGFFASPRALYAIDVESQTIKRNIQIPSEQWKEEEESIYNGTAITYTFNSFKISEDCKTIFAIFYSPSNRNNNMEIIELSNLDSSYKRLGSVKDLFTEGLSNSWDVLLDFNDRERILLLGKFTEYISLDVQSYSNPRILGKTTLPVGQALGLLRFSSDGKRAVIGTGEYIQVVDLYINIPKFMYPMSTIDIIQSFRLDVDNRFQNPDDKIEVLGVAPNKDQICFLSKKQGIMDEIISQGIAELEAVYCMNISNPKEFSRDSIIENSTYHLNQLIDLSKNDLILRGKIALARTSRYIVAPIQTVFPGDDDWTFGFYVFTDLSREDGGRYFVTTKKANSIVLSQDDQIAFLADGDGGLKMFNISKYNEAVLISTLECSNAKLVALSPNGNIILLRDGYDLVIIDVRNLEQPRVIHRLIGDYVIASRITFSSDGNIAFIRTEEGILWMLDVSNLLDIGNPSIPDANFWVPYTRDKEQPIFATILELSPNGETAFVISGWASPKHIDIMDFSNLISPSVIGSVNLEREVFDIKFSADGQYAFLFGKYSVYILALPKYLMYISESKFMLGKKCSSHVTILTENPFNTSKMNFLDVSYKFISVSLYNAALLSDDTLSRSVLPLPDWIIFEKESSKLIISPSSATHIGSLTLQAIISLKIPTDLFVSIGAIVSLNDSLDLIVYLMSQNYIDKEGFLTSEFDPKQPLFLNSQNSLYERFIRKKLAQYQFILNTPIEITSSLLISFITSNISSISRPYISFTTLSNNPITLSIELSLQEEEEEKQQIKFISRSYPAFSSITKDGAKIYISGSKNDVLETLKLLRIAFLRENTHCNGTITLSDGLNPEEVQIIQDISYFFIIHEPPKLNYQLFENGVNINVAKAWSFTIPANLFIDPNYNSFEEQQQQLNYQIYLLSSTTKTSNMINLPSSMTFDKNRNLFTVEPNLEDLEFDSQNRLYKRIYNLCIVASNEAEQMQTYSFSLQISNAAPIINKKIQPQINRVYVYTGSQFVIKLDSDTFTDFDKDSIIYTISMQDEQERIPDWLEFKDLTLFGVPPEELSLKVELKIIASDEIQTVEESFILEVTPSYWYLLKLIATYVGPLLGIFGLWQYYTIICNFLFKKKYRFPQPLNVYKSANKGNNQAKQQQQEEDEEEEEIIPLVRFIQDDMSQIKFILTKLQDLQSKQFPAVKPKGILQTLKFRFCNFKTYIATTYFNIPTKEQVALAESLLNENSLYQINESELRMLIKKSLIGSQEDLKPNIRVLDALKCKIIRWKLKSKDERLTKKIFEEFINDSKSYSDLIERQISGEEGGLPDPDENLVPRFNLKETSLKGMLEQKGFLPRKATHSQEKIFYHHPNVEGEILNYLLLKTVLLAHAHKSCDLITDEYEIGVATTLVQESRPWYKKMLEFFFVDVSNANFGDEGSIGYGIEYKLRRRALYLIGDPVDDMCGRNFIVRIIKSGAILKEFQVTCLPPNQQQQQISTAATPGNIQIPIQGTGPPSKISNKI